MRGQRKNPRKAVQPFENKKRKIDIFKNYEANGVEKIQRKLEIFSTLISKKSNLAVSFNMGSYESPLTALPLCSEELGLFGSPRLKIEKEQFFLPNHCPNLNLLTWNFTSVNSRTRANGVLTGANA